MNSFNLYKDGLDDNQILANWIYNYVISHCDKSIGLLSHKQYYSDEVLLIVRNMLISNKPELIDKARHYYIKLHNGCSIVTGNITTATSSMRGRTIDVMLLDNFNLYKPKLVKDFFYCYMPVMACRNNTEIGFILNTQEKISKENMNYIYSVYKK